jgi:cell division transport system permease protein
MDLHTAFLRARRGFREDAKLYAVAVSSLAVAFLCLAAALLAITNLSAMASRWSRSGRMTVYLRDGAPEADVQQLRATLAEVPDVSAVTLLSAAGAREQFVRDANVGGELAGLPADAFPASLEVTLRLGTPPARADEIAARVGRAGVVESVETYRAFFQQLESLVLAGRTTAGIVALLVLICVLAVVGNTIRLAVAGRRDEIEVLKLCGATDGFVRGPFLVEGALQGFTAALVAVLLLGLGYAVLRGQLDGTLSALTGVRAVFLDPVISLAIVVGGGLAGVLGSAVSLRRYLVV